ncbi:hypothetical protein DM02DRAFT_687918 [Periconia macrospinosa]|uniref:Uncharacterized protein n=1 Tax=Periconia macrospinosa TaxID=97972 RepID=A0A2V1DFC5_9PLEO|nr:hypothetical protein DM02DRAFT_687918 [Periconia macrospinosa]
MHKKHPKFKPCAPASQFTIDYFRKNAVKTPRPDKCLFYTAGLSNVAKLHAKKNGFITIWDIWAGQHMRWEPYQLDNPMRCIIAPDLPKNSGNRNPVRQKYFETMSTAMASMCSGKVTVMDRNLKAGTHGRIKQAGIWGHNEFPRLVKDGKTTSIDAIGMFNDTDASTKVRWDNWWLPGQQGWGNDATRPGTLL